MASGGAGPPLGSCAPPVRRLRPIHAVLITGAAHDPGPMSEPEGVALGSAPASARPNLSFIVTVVCSIIVAIYVGLPLGPLLHEASPLGQLDRPEQSLQRLVTRELDLDEALRHGRSW